MVVVRQHRRPGRRGEEPRAPVRDVRLVEARIGDRLEERAVRKEAVGGHRPDGLPLDLVGGGPRPVLGIDGVREEALDRPHHLAGYVGLLEGRVDLKAMPERAKVAGNGGCVVADAGDKTEAGDEDSGHALRQGCPAHRDKRHNSVNQALIATRSGGLAPFSLSESGWAAPLTTAGATTDST